MNRKIPVGVLAATGVVGRQLLDLLTEHPFFELACVAASERSLGCPLGQHVIQACEPPYPCELLFSALPSESALHIEREAVAAGYTVVSNASAYRTDLTVPLVVPEVNGTVLDAQTQHVTNPNCVVAGLSLALKALHDAFGLEAVHVVTLQAISGAGYPGVASLDILGNVLPDISGEAEKIESEPRRLLGLPDLPISAQVNRVPVRDGHLSRVSVKLAAPTTPEEVEQVLKDFQGLSLPSAPKHPIRLADALGPQPMREGQRGSGMEVWVGQVERCPLLGVRFALLSHNLIRGAAGAALLNAELLQHKKSLKLAPV